MEGPRKMALLDSAYYEKLVNSQSDPSTPPSQNTATGSHNLQGTVTHQPPQAPFPRNTSVPYTQRDEIRNMMSNLDTSMGNILNSENLSPDEKIMFYNTALNKFLGLPKKITSTPVPVKITHPLSFDTDEKAEISEDVVQRSIKMSPKTYRDRVEGVFDYLKSIPNIRWSDTGELKIDGRTIPNTNIGDLALDVVRARKSFDPNGWKDLSNALRKHNIPRTLVGNQKRWDFMQGARLRSETHPEFETAENEDLIQEGKGASRMSTSRIRRLGSKGVIPYNKETRKRLEWLSF